MTTRAKFEIYHAENPHVYEMIKRLAFKAIRAGRTLLSIQQIFEVLRWEYSLQTKEVMKNPDDPTRTLKLNDNYRCYYSRLFMDEHPRYEGIFRTRGPRHKVDVEPLRADNGDPDTIVPAPAPHKRRPDFA